MSKLSSKVTSYHTSDPDADLNTKPEIWQNVGHEFDAQELQNLKRSIVAMALSRVDGHDELYVGG